MTVTVDDVSAAARRVDGRVHRTPVLGSTRLGERAGGVALSVKAELLQKTGSFKPRGALNRLLAAPRDELAAGLITVSAGNHAGGLAWAAAEVGVRATVVMPESTGRLKVEATRGYGAEVVLHGDVRAAFEEMERLREERGLVLVHPFDDPLVVAGQGTVGLEIASQVPDADVVVVPVGGGGLIGGVATAIAGSLPGCRVYGVEPEGAAAMRASLDTGEPVRLDRVDTVVDSLAAPYAGTHGFEAVRAHVDDVVTLADDEIVEAMAEVWHLTKLYAEPAGAAALAALVHGRVPVEPGEVVVAVVSGGNLDPAEIPSLL